MPPRDFASGRNPCGGNKIRGLPLGKPRPIVIRLLKCFSLPFFCFTLFCSVLPFLLGKFASLFNLVIRHRRLCFIFISFCIACFSQIFEKRALGYLNEEEESLFMTLRRFDSFCSPCSNFVTLPE